MTTYPTPPVIGTRVLVTHANGYAYETTVIGFDPSDGAVFVDGGEIVANHLGDVEISHFQVIR
jgi:hypothetical protein